MFSNGVHKLQIADDVAQRLAVQEEPIWVCIGLLSLHKHTRLGDISCRWQAVVKLVVVELVGAAVDIVDAAVSACVVCVVSLVNVFPFCHVKQVIAHR